MAKVDGVALRFYVNTGTYGSPTYTAIDCEGESSLTINRGEKEVTGKCSSGLWMELLGTGVGDWELSVSGHINAGDTAWERMVSDMLNNVGLVKMQWKTLNSKTFSGDGQYTTQSISAPYDGVVDFSFTFKGSSTLSYA